MLRRLRPVLVTAAACSLLGCQLPSDSETVSTDAEVTLTVTPQPASAVRASGRSYTVTRTDKPDEVREYDWVATFTVTLTESSGAAVDIKGMTVKVQQAFGGIVAPPTTGDVEHYEFVSRPSSNRLPGSGSATVEFDVWYDLPNTGREALVTVTLSFLDKNEDEDDDRSDDNDDLNDVQFTKSIDVRIQ